MKLAPMQRKYLLRASLILLLIAGSYLVLWSTTRTHTQKEACSESMEECCKKASDKDGSGEMIWETFSRQFISTSVTE
jgi:type II secretory pathway component PulM